MSTFWGQKYVPKYQEDYFKLPWYEHDLIKYFDYLDYKDMSDDPNAYFKNKEVINFELIHHKCCGDPL